MSEMPLKASEKKALQSAILDSGIPVDEFEVVEVDASWVGILDDTTPAFHHKETGFTWGFFFVPDMHDDVTGARIKGGYACILTPGIGAPYEERKHLDRSGLLAAFVEWLQLIKREVNAVTPGRYRAPQPAEDPVHGKSAVPTDTPLVESAGPSADPNGASDAVSRRSSVNEWLEREASERGRFWVVLAKVAALLIALLGLVLAVFRKL